MPLRERLPQVARVAEGKTMGGNGEMTDERCNKCEHIRNRKGWSLIADCAITGKEVGIRSKCKIGKFKPRNCAEKGRK